MTNAYQVLGLSRGASEDEVRSAYRKLAKKYDPNQFDEGPLRDDCKQRLDEINAAFDSIMSDMRMGGAGTSRGGTNYDALRAMIQNGNPDGALQELNTIANGKNDAEWNFLVGSAYYYKGWVADAVNYFEDACRLDPTNREYQEALHNLQNNAQGNMYGNPYANQGNAYYNNAAGCSCCDLCTAMICMDMCCGGGCC